MGLRYVAVVSFGLLFCCQAQDAFSQLTYTIQVVDASDHGSPLKVSGTASYAEIKKQNAFQTSSRFEILLKNTSQKEIILLRATVKEGGPHGPVKEHEITRDHFFWGEISVGSSIRLVSDEGQVATTLSSIAPAREPNAEFHLQYVQFADGSAWGNESAAQDAFAARSAIFGMLLRLQSENNNQHFVALLKERIQPDEADSFFDSFRQVRKNKGMATARQNVAASLRVASAHESSMRQVLAGKKRRVAADAFRSNVP